MPNLVTPTYSSLRILDKTQMGILPVSGFLVQSFIKESCHKSRSANDIDMNLGPLRILTGKKAHSNKTPVLTSIGTLNISLKKWKDTLETRTELAFLRSYVENQAILELILFYRVSNCKQTKNQDSKDCLWTSIFTLL